MNYFRADCLLTILIISCVTFGASLKHKYRPCVQKGFCVCEFPNRSGINATKLADHDFGWTKINDTSDIFVNLCTDKPVGENNTLNECFKGVSICLRVNITHETKYINLGNSADGKFFSPHPNEPIFLQFIKNNRTTLVNFLCTEIKTIPRSLEVSEKSDTKYVLGLSSFESCLMAIEPPVHPSGLSFGSIFVLIFIVFALVYFGGGMLTLKFLRGAEGKEMIPNYEFWADLPYLVRDGVLFTLNGCQQSPSYDRI